MTDIEIAKQNLIGHTISLCKNGQCLTSDKRGITPMMELINDKFDLTGYAAADIVVGRAVALLFAYAEIREIYAKVLSEGALEVCKKYRIAVKVDKNVSNIINRKGDDICPMEKAVENVTELKKAVAVLQAKFCDKI